MYMDSIWNYISETMRSEVYWDELFVGEEMEGEYPELADALLAMNEQRRADMEALSGELTELAEEMDGEVEWVTSLYGSFDYFVQRADSKVLSVRSDSTVYWGGMHEEYGTAGVNLSPETGMEIALGDVLVNRDALLEMIAQRIDEIRPEVYREDVLNALKGLADEEFEWTLGYEGVTFYFNPYVIPEAVGRLIVMFTYDEVRELMNPEYRPDVIGSAYAVKVPWFEQIPFELDPLSSELDSLMLTAVMGEYEAYEQIRIEVNGEAYEEETFAYNLEAYLVVTGVGVGQKCFLYLEAVSENDYTRLVVYDLNGEAPVKVGELEATGLAGGWYYEAEVFDDPTEFELDTRLEILGTRTGVRTYTIGEHTGMPMPKTDYFEISDNGYPMTSLIDLKVRMLDTNAEETIPAGTEFYEIRTDGESYVDFRLNDGRECRIEVDTDGYPDTIDGIPEDECFEGIMYAG